MGKLLLEAGLIVNNQKLQVMPKKIILYSFFVLLFFNSFSQTKTDSLAINKISFDGDYTRNYSTVNFHFYYLNIGKEIKIVALNIDDIRLGTTPQNGNGLIQVYLSDKKTYKVFVKHGMYEPSRIFDIDVDTNYDYNIDIYLSPPKSPLQ